MKNKVFLKLGKKTPKNVTPKLGGRGGGDVRALLARPLKKTFLFATFNNNVKNNIDLKNNIWQNC